MTTLIIDDSNTQAKAFVRYALTLPFVVEKAEPEQTFEEVCAECDATTLDEFFNEVDKQIEQHYRNA